MKIQRLEYFFYITILLQSSFIINAQRPLIYDPEVILISSGFQFVEGPVWKEGTGILFSDIPANAIYHWDEASGVDIFLTPSGNSNGLAIDRDNNLLIAQHGPRQIAALDSSNTLTTLSSHYNGNRLNSPNDIAVHSDGSIFFTDPPYGLNDQHATPELSFNGIFRLNSKGELFLLDSTLARPNGITFSPDASILYVSDSEARKIYKWNVMEDSVLTGKEEFASIQVTGYADGMKTDSNGFLYVAGPIGIWIFDTSGNPVDTIPIPGQTTNCAWGDADGKSLYVTSGNSLYKIRNKGPVSLEQKVKAVQYFYGNCFPNPFLYSANIPFYMEESNFIKLDVCNVRGEKIVTLHDGPISSGPHSTIFTLNDNLSGLFLIRAAVNNMAYFAAYVNKL